MMNAFFHLLGGGGELGHLSELAKGQQIDSTQISRLDRPLVKDISQSQGDKWQGYEDLDGAEFEASQDGREDGSTVEETGPESGEGRELTPEEINEKQRAAIKDALERIARGEELTTAEKGNLCEMMMDQYFIRQGYTPLHEQVTSLDSAGHKGIDGVYQKDGKYAICDAKYDTARLNETQDGTQMSWEWIDARLDDAVGRDKAEEIREAYEDNPADVFTGVYHFDPVPDETGAARSDMYRVDEYGKKSGDSVAVEAFQDFAYTEAGDTSGGDVNA